MTKTNWIDFKELRKQLNFADVLRHYGVELKTKGDQHHGFCPLPSHNGKKNSPSFSANLKRGIWQCFGCGEKGNVLDFAVLMERANPKSGEDVRRVASKLKERFAGGSASPSPQEPPKETDNDENIVINAPLDFELKGLDATHSYLHDRGLTKKTIATFGLGYCSRGLLAKRIAIPIHDATGELIGYAGRVVDDNAISDENPKYKFPGRRKRNGVIHEFRKSLLLYNVHKISAGSDLVVVEGFASVWYLHEIGIRNVVSTMGASCSDEQARMLCTLFIGRLYIICDGDAAGRRWSDEVTKRITSGERTVCFTHIWPERGKQPTDYSPSDLKYYLRDMRGGWGI